MPMDWIIFRYDNFDNEVYFINTVFFELKT